MLFADVHDHANLCSALQRIDISVPPRTKGRTTRHTEIWTICRLLSTLADADGISYPVSLHHDDKPDFLVSTGVAKIGVEITEAIPESYAAYCAIAEREFPGACLDVGLFRPGMPTLSAEEIRELLRKNRLSSKGWGGNSVEHEWAAYVRGAVEKKLERLARPDFRKFDQNWLSVYANLPLPDVHLEEAIGLLLPLLQDCWRRTPAFDALFIEEGRSIVQVTAKGGERLVLRDLWSPPEAIDNFIDDVSDADLWPQPSL